MWDGSTVESANRLAPVNATEKRRGVPRVAVMREFFVPRAEAFTEVPEARTPLVQLENRSRGPFAAITNPKTINSIPYPITRTRYELHHGFPETQHDLIEATQEVLKVVVPFAALGAVGAVVLAFSEAIPGFFLTAGSYLSAAITAFPPIALGLGATALLWLALQVRNENLYREKIADFRASSRARR